MARLPSLVPAESDYAAWMRAYRAHKSGRGPNPGPRRAWEDAAAKRRLGEILTDAERSWKELADRVLEVGGICPNADYGWDSIPRPVYRVNGKPADLVNVLLEAHGYHFESDVDLVCSLWARYETLKRAREDAA